MQDELLNLQAESQRTIVFISHDLSVIHEISDRVVVLQQGRMVESGPLSVWCDRGTPNVAGTSVEACGGGLFHVPMPIGNRDQIVTITR